MTRTIDTLGPKGARLTADPSADAVREQLQRILQNPGLQGSARRRDLLSFLVEEALEGRADQLKGFSVALAVFGRDAAFDTGADPVVRLEAGRLRRSLDTYYADAGKDDALRITIPKGAYVPHFAWRSPEAMVPGTAVVDDPASYTNTDAVSLADRTGSTGGDRGRLMRRSVAALAVLAIVTTAGGAWYWFHPRAPVVAGDRGPTVIVLPFESSGAGDDIDLIASGMTQELITALMRFPDFRLYSLTDSFRQGENAASVDLGRQLGVTYVVGGSVQSSAGKLRLRGQLADASSGEVPWSGSYDRTLTTRDLLDVQDELTTAIATELGEPFGVVNHTTAWRMNRGDAPSMPSYACILRAYDYRRTYDDVLFAPALACLEAAVVRDPDYADAWAMLGWLHLDAARQDMVPAAEHPAQMAAAFDAAAHALDLDAQNQRGLEALAAITFANGDFAESDRLQREALALNPYDPETLAQYGWRLAARGNWDEGLPFLNEAIARSANPPGWYFHLISVHDYLVGDYASALAAAERSAKVGSAIGLSLAAISHAKLGDMAAARDDLAAMAEAWPFLARDPAAAYRSFQADESIIDPLVEGLRAAGWTEPEAAPGISP
jgi:TolB-like protein